MVRIVSGPLLDHEGKVVEIKNRTVKIVLPSLGYMMSAEVETAKVEVIRESLNYQSTSQVSIALG